MFCHLLQRIIDASDGLSQFFILGLSLSYARTHTSLSIPPFLSLLSHTHTNDGSHSHTGMMVQFDPTTTWVLTEFCRRYAVSEAYRGTVEFSLFIVFIGTSSLSNSLYLFLSLSVCLICLHLSEIRYFSLLANAWSQKRSHLALLEASLRRYVHTHSHMFLSLSLSRS